MKKGTKIVDFKGERFTVLGLAVQAETLEEMIFYENDKEKKMLVLPVSKFYEKVDFEGEKEERFKKVPIGQRGGEVTTVMDLEVGTKFYVHNGVWDGEIVMKDGKKCVLFEGDTMENAKEISKDKTLDITIKK